jgi:serine/threonine protein kinase
MTESFQRLAAALADRYTIERELGQGGMATVYLAGDLKHERQVAIKVLREDLAATLGSGRFLRDIKIAAQLQHPHSSRAPYSRSTGPSKIAAPRSARRAASASSPRTRRYTW